MAVLITDTTLRDAHQSLIATRMQTKDMLNIVEEMDEVGFFSLEAWGGATFDSCMRFLNEDPWDRLRQIKQRAKKTKLQMLLRGQNLVGYRHYPDDIVDEFIRLSVKNGISVMRVFDALNDIRNMEVAIKSASKYGAHVQGAICYTTSPVHNLNTFVKMAEDLQNLGCDSICIKDMAGLISPTESAKLIKAIKKKIDLPVDLHSHCTSGMAPISYYTAAQAGADILDTAFSAFSWGTSQPPTESMVAAFKNTSLDTMLDMQKLYEIGEYFAALREKYRPLVTMEAIRPSVNVLLHQIPGGMLSNLVSQLREQDALDKISEVLEEVPRVRADFGYPPLVTPTSQLVGTQAVLNVMTGERYKKVTNEVKNYLLGLYGRPPAPINEEVLKKVVNIDERIDVRPAELLKPELKKLKADVRKLGIAHKEEDVISYALYPQIALKFLRGEMKEEPIKIRDEAAHAASAGCSFPTEFSVDVDGEIFNIKISSVVGKPVEAASPKEEEKPKGSILAPMSGMILTIKVKVGDKVKKDDLVAVMEAMKMQNEIHSPYSGTIKEILSFEGEVVSARDIVMVVDSDDK
jgi:pyruvate carboxylase subunit B